MTERSRRVPEGVRPTEGLRRAQNRWQNRVMERHALDEVTTEVVRLRAAAHHDCHT